MTGRGTPSPLGTTQLVDEFFVENRNRLIEIAAFLDRLDRSDRDEASGDFRMRAFHDALAALATAGPNRVVAIQMLLSDPTSEPLPALDRKGAIGAYDAAARKASR